MAHQMPDFSSRDLAHFVPDNAPGDAFSLRHTETGEKIETYEPVKPKIDPSKKVSRYRAGHVPKWAEEVKEEDKFPNRRRTPHKPEIVISSKPRFKAKVISVTSPGKDNKIDEKKVQQELSDSDSIEISSSEEEDEDAILERRRKLKELHLKREIERESMKETEEVIDKEESEDDARIEKEIVQKEESSEWETDTDASDEEAATMLKPIFVPRAARETKLQIEKMEREQERRAEEKLEKLRTRKEETRELVAAELLKEAEALNVEEDKTDAEMPDDTDDLDPESEYKAWELRELRRLKRENDKREDHARELAETERRRKLTPEERELEDEKLKKNKPKEKKKWKFLQKYYHKGVFFMDESSVKAKEDVRLRDASGATLDDQFDKSTMPKVMQVKNFGRSGRTKYTHLVDQDTTDRTTMWYQQDEIREKHALKLSGVGDIDNAGRKRKYSERKQK